MCVNYFYSFNLLHFFNIARVAEIKVKINLNIPAMLKDFVAILKKSKKAGNKTKYRKSGIPPFIKGGDICNKKLMDYGKKKLRTASTCLECGDRIRYGRSDKRFCCEDCRNKYNNALAKSGRMTRRKVLSHLSKNYDILENLLKSGVESVDMMDLVAMGFAPAFVTSFKKLRSRYEFGCFDIKYIMTADRIYSISKIQNLSVNLRGSSYR